MVLPVSEKLRRVRKELDYFESLGRILSKPPIGMINAHKKTIAELEQMYNKNKFNKECRHGRASMELTA